MKVYTCYGENVNCVVFYSYDDYKINIYKSVSADNVNIYIDTINVPDSFRFILRVDMGDNTNVQSVSFTSNSLITKDFSSGDISVGKISTFEFIKTTDNGLLISRKNIIKNGSETSQQEQIYDNNVNRCLTFRAIEDGTIGIHNVGGNTPDIKYSLDNGNTWTQWDYSDISVSTGGAVMMKGNNTSGFNSDYIYSYFVFSNKIEAYGNTMSLLYDGDLSILTIPSDYCFGGLFNNCTGLTTAPELPATSLQAYCYRDMFYGCTGLTTAPELPATSLAQGCYSQMFARCTSLTTTPALPATTLADICYNSMFYNCTNLASAPELPATSLAQGCYMRMFAECYDLRYIKCLATDITATQCTFQWVYNVNLPDGTFVKDKNMGGWTVGVDGIPQDWTVRDNTQSGGITQLSFWCGTTAEYNNIVVKDKNTIYFLK